MSSRPRMMSLLPSLILSLTDLAALSAAFLVSTFATELVQTRLLDRSPGAFYAPFLADRLAIVTSLSFLLLAWFAHSKHFTGRPAYWTEVRDILLGIAAIALIDGWLHFALKMQASRLWQFQLWCYAAIFLLCGRLTVRYVLAKLGLWRLPTILIGSTSAVQELRAFTTAERYLGYDVWAVLTINPHDEDVLARLDAQLTSQTELAHALVASDGVPNSLLPQILEALDRAKIRYGLVPPLRGFPLLGLAIEHFLGYDFIILQSYRQSFARQKHAWMAKRTFDLIAAALLLTVAAPLLVAIATLLKLEGGPVLYQSRRLGYAGSTFSALKFRTMKPNADTLLKDLLVQNPRMQSEWQTTFKLNNDPRITWLGSFLRKNSLDELPQLINVLRGEMSLVGPRPLLLDEMDEYRPWLHLYTRVLPGITGVWQVNGRSSLAYARRIQLNNWYVNNGSFWHDLVILLKTCVVVASRRGAQ